MVRVGGSDLRSKRVTVSLSIPTYERIKASADDVGLSVNAWCAYTLGTAAASQVQMREKMSDEMVRLLAQVIAEGVEDGSLPK
jgi:hypothetical protein